jgi:hypothetical protein
MANEISKKGVIKALKSTGMTAIDAKKTAKGMNLSRRMSADQVDSRLKKVIAEKGEKMEFEGLSSKGKTGLRKNMLKTAQEESSPQKAPTTSKQDKKAEKEKILAGILGKDGENSNNPNQNPNQPNILEKIHTNSPQQPQNQASRGFASMADFQQQKEQKKQQKKGSQNQKADINKPAGFGIQNTNPESPKGVQELQI